MSWTGNNNWQCNQCGFKVHAPGSQVSNPTPTPKTVQRLRTIIAHLEIHNGDKRI